MKLTRGQMDALVRKAQIIVEKKKAAKRDEYCKTWKPNKAVEEFLGKLKLVDKARNAYRKAAEDVGLEFTYSSVIVDISKFGGTKYNRESFYHDTARSFYEDSKEKIMRNQIEEKAKKDGVRFPTLDEIRDEIELAGLDRSFDMDAFLQKYESL